jgi:hypothetical protein
MPLPQRTLAVVGTHHPNKGKQVDRRFEIAMCRIAELVQLVPEPKNKHDEHAMAVFSARNIQIGYLPAEKAPLISAMLMRGDPIRAVFQEATAWGALIRVSFDGEVPVIPLKRQGEHQAPDELIDEDPGFYPDDEWAE